MIHNPKILKEFSASDAQGSVEICKILQNVCKESDHENVLNNFCGIFFCIYTYTHP